MSVIIDGTNGVSGVSGSAGTPAFTDSVDAGMFFPAANTVAFSTADTERLRVTSAGGVSFGSSGNATGTTGQALISQGNAAPVWGSALVSDTAKASTSGTNIDFTSIPSWVKRVSVIFNGVSTNGANSVLIQLGTSGGFATSGYLGSGVDGPTLAGTLYTAGIGIRSSATSVMHGAVQLYNITSNSWTASGVLTKSDTAGFLATAGSISLAGVLTQVRITTLGGVDAFDAGTINIIYE